MKFANLFAFRIFMNADSEVAAAPVTDAIATDSTPVIPVAEAVAIAETTPAIVADQPTVAPKAPKAKSKPKAKKVVKKAKKVKGVSKNGKRLGRPLVYTASQRKYLAGLIRKYGASNTRKILTAKKNRPFQFNGKAIERNIDLFPKAKSPSMPYLLKLAKEEGIELFQGRPKVAA